MRRRNALTAIRLHDGPAAARSVPPTAKVLAALPFGSPAAPSVTGCPPPQRRPIMIRTLAYSSFFVILLTGIAIAAST
jgi:hypothetical protein